jgi:transcriptional regulator with XRE-family HTH domain
MAEAQPGRITALLQKFDPIGLAEKVAVSRQTIWSWQTGRSLPPRYLLEDLASATGLSLEELREARHADKLARDHRASAI